MGCFIFTMLSVTVILEIRGFNERKYRDHNNTYLHIMSASLGGKESGTNMPTVRWPHDSNKRRNTVAYNYCFVRSTFYFLLAASCQIGYDTSRAQGERMNAQNTRYLFENFSFFGEDIKTYGFCCGDGWFDLIKNLCEEFLTLKLPDNLLITTIKEKGGTLCIYLENASADFSRFAQAAEQESEKICEYCGKPASLQRKQNIIFLLKAVCTFHNDLYRKERTWPSA